MNQNQERAFQREVEALQAVRNIHLVRMLGHSADSLLQRPNQPDVHVAYLVLEKCTNGDLFNWTSIRAFSDGITRRLFRQILYGVHQLHLGGFAHRDIKLDNIFLGANFIVKVADFGFARNLEGNDGDGLLHTRLGTPGY